MPPLKHSRTRRFLCFPFCAFKTHGTLGKDSQEEPNVRRRPEARASLTPVVWRGRKFAQ